MFVFMRENLIIQQDNLGAAYVIRLWNLNLKLEFKYIATARACKQNCCSPQQTDIAFGTLRNNRYILIYLRFYLGLTITLIKESRNAQCAIMLHSIWQAV